MKRILLNLLFILSILICPMPKAWSQPKGYSIVKDTASFRKIFNEKSKNIQSNQAEFTQEKYLSVLTEKEISKGKFYYKKQNKMRWEIVSPTPSVIVLINGKMIVKEKGKTKTFDATSNKTFKGLNDLMLTTASGTMLNNKEYSYALFENARTYCIVLTPRAASTKKFIKSIEVVVEKSDYTVNQLKMIESDDDYTLISFQNKLTNAAIEDTVFILK